MQIAAKGEGEVEVRLRVFLLQLVKRPTDVPRKVYWFRSRIRTSRKLVHLIVCSD